MNRTTGRWADFAVPGLSGGDLISLYAAQKNLKQSEAYDEICQSMGYQLSVVDKGSIPKEFKPAPPAFLKPPHDAPLPNFHHKEDGPPQSVHVYRDLDGEVLFYIARYEPEGRRKQLRPFSWVQPGRWVSKIWEAPRPLFGLETLKDNQNQVLIVEGEKAALAAREIVGPSLSVLTWPGGAKAVRKADWSVLAGRKVVIWPDRDDEGWSAAEDIKELVAPLASEIKVIRVEESRPQGWDAADALAEGMDFAKFKAWAKPLVRSLDKNTRLALVRTEQVTESGEAEPMSPPWQHFKLSKKGEVQGPKLTIENVASLVDFLGIGARYNVISKEFEFTIPGKDWLRDTERNSKIAQIKSYANQYDLPSFGIEEMLFSLASQRPYNPVATWVSSKPWDGASRLNEFFSTVKARNEDTDPTQKSLKETLILRWLVSAIASAFEPSGASSGGVLVFVGEQYLGKTKWFKSLVPEELRLWKESVILKLGDFDSLKQALSYWLVELGEINSTFRKSDSDEMKAFLISSSDVIRRKYGRVEEQFARRTVFFGSVNDWHYLVDPTGNRRYWTIDCEWINHSHGMDMQQVWAEVYELYKTGEPWRLTAAEVDALNAHNEAFQSIDPIEELIDAKFNWEAPDIRCRWLNATQICEQLGLKNITRAHANRAAAVMKRRGVRCQAKTKRFRIPPVIESEVPWSY